MEKERKPQLQVELSKGAYTVSQSLSSEVEQDDNSNDKLHKDQKTSSSETVNKFYLKIQSMKKEYPPELWNTAYKNILGTLQKETTSIGYEERISLLRWQITSMDQEIMKACKFQQAYEECYEIFKKRKSLLFSNFVKQIEWMQEILNSITH